MRWSGGGEIQKWEGQRHEVWVGEKDFGINTYSSMMKINRKFGRIPDDTYMLQLNIVLCGQ